MAAKVPHRKELLDACAEFACKPTSDTLYVLMNRADGKEIVGDKTNDTVRILVAAIAGAHRGLQSAAR